MLEISFLIALHAITYLYGTGLIGWLDRKKDNKENWLIVFSLGYAILSIIVTLAYVWGATIAWIAYAIIPVGIIVAALGIKPHNIFSKNFGYGITAFFLIVILLLLPKYTGGDQFSIFQGNIYDHFNYLTSALVYSVYDYQTLHTASSDAFLADPLMIVPQSNLESRPAVMVLFSVFGYLFGGKYLELAYVYNLFFLLQLLLVLTWSTRLFGMKIRTGMLLSLIVCGGFWGQLIFDMNAWSHLAAMPLLVLFITQSLHQLSHTEGNEWSPFFIISLMVLSSLYLYPEATIFLGAGIGILALMQIRKKSSKILKFGIAGFSAVILALLDYKSTLFFLVNQIRFASGETPGWYQYYFSFLFGNDGITEGLKLSLQNRIFHLNFFQDLLQELLDIIPGFMGLFFLTPSIEMQTWNAWLLRLLINGFIIALWIFYVKELMRWIREKPKSGEIMPLHFLGYLTIQLIIIGFLVINHQIWAATKGWLYVIPFLMLIFFLPFFTGEKTKNAGKFFLAVFITFQLGFAVIRPFAAAANGGIHYSFKPYPGSLPQAGKDRYSWDIEVITQVTKGCQSVLIPQTYNPFYEHFLMLVLRQNRINFQKTTPVNRYYGESADIGQMHRNKMNCILKLDSNQPLINVSKVKNSD